MIWFAYSLSVEESTFIGGAISRVLLVTVSVDGLLISGRESMIKEVYSAAGFFIWIFGDSDDSFCQLHRIMFSFELGDR